MIERILSHWRIDWFEQIKEFSIIISRKNLKCILDIFLHKKKKERNSKLEE